MKKPKKNCLLCLHAPHVGAGVEPIQVEKSFVRIVPDHQVPGLEKAKGAREPKCLLLRVKLRQDSLTREQMIYIWKIDGGNMSWARWSALVGVPKQGFVCRYATANALDAWL